MTEQNRITLTDALIKGTLLPPGKREHFLHDAEQPGLLLRIRDSGAKTFQFRSRDSARITLGRFPAIKVAAARRAAAALAGDQARGIDLFKQQSEAKQAAKAEANRATLGTLIAEDGPYERSLKARQVVNWKTAMSALRRHLQPGHGSSDVRMLTRLHITTAMNGLTPGAAADLRKHAHTFLSWCEAQGHIAHNPLLGMRAPKATRAEQLGKRKRGRMLDDGEIIRVWTAAGQMGAFGLLVRICLLAGARRSEPAQITWTQHVLADRVCFDDEMTKMGRGYYLPRTDLTNDILTAAQYFRRATVDLVFPGQRNTPISGFTKSVIALTEQAGVAKFTLHDLRRTARSIMARLGWDDDIQRLCVGQKPRGIDQVYNLDEQAVIRRLCFSDFHAYLQALIEGERTDNVVRLARIQNPRNQLKAELLDRLRQHHAQAEG